jgi:S-adenosylmethionine-dependent methyltransferase
MERRDDRDRFDAYAGAWADYNRQPLGRIRGEVTWRNLLPYLPSLADAAEPPRVLDAGGGSGELALRLVGQGYRVWLLDYAPAMLEQARQAAAELPAEAQARLTCCLLSADEAAAAFDPGFFDVVTCHTLVEYLPDPQATLRQVVGVLAPGGLLSLSFVNRHAEVQRQVWRHGDPAGALARLQEGRFCARLFDVPGRAYTAAEGAAWLADLGLAVVATYGVRAFADQVPAARLDDPAFFAALLQLELTAAGLSPYRDVARYVHVIAHLPGPLSPVSAAAGER